MVDSFGGPRASRRALSAPARVPVPAGYHPDRRPQPNWKPDDPPEHYAPIELSPKVLRHLERIAYEGKSEYNGRTFRVKSWSRWPMHERLAFLRDFVQDTARDPAIVRKATRILQKAGAPSKDHRAQWAALLAWTQRNIYYVNERDERFQSPQYTLTERHGDCDDCAVVLAALGDSLRLPWRFVISGKDKSGNLVVYVENTGPIPQNVNWTHIYVQVGGPPFKPQWWTFAEPTLSVPLGWSVATRDGSSVEGRADLSGLGSATSPAASSATPTSSGGVALPTRALALAKQHGPKVALSVATSVISLILVDLVLRALGKRKRGR